MSALAADEIESYQQRGYVVPRARLPAPLLDRLIA